MPPVRYTPQELAEGAELIKDPNNQPDVIERRYRTGEITLQDKIEMLRAYGQIQREVAIHQEIEKSKAKGEAVAALGGGATGEIKLYAQGVASGFQSAWNAAEAGKPAQAVLRGMMAGLEALKAYDIPGDIIERWALEGGASPGLARAANWAVWLPTNFLGLTTMFRPVTATAGAAIRGVAQLKAAKSEMFTFLKDPVGQATRSAKGIDMKLVNEAVEATVKTGKAVKTTEALEGVKPTAPAWTMGDDAAEAGAPALAPPAGFAAPAEVEKMAVMDLIEFYEKKSNVMVRKGISHAQTKTEAAASPISFREMIDRAPGEPVSAAVLENLAGIHGKVKAAWETVLEESATHADDIAAGARPDLVLAFKAHLSAMEMTNPAFLGAVGEAGRGLEYVKTMQDLIKGTEFTLGSRSWDNILNSISADKLMQGTDEAFAVAVKKLSLLEKESRSTFIKEVAKDHGPGILHSLYKNLLFLAPSTHVVNTFGSISQATSKVATDYASVFVSGGKTLAEANAEAAGMMTALSHLPRLLGQAAKRSGENLEKQGLQGAEDAIARYGTGRWMAFEDELIGGVLEAGLVQGAAMKEAIKQGITGKNAQKRFVNQLISDPVQVAKLSQEVAGDVAHTMFHDPLSKWGEKIADGIRNSPLDFWMPIIKFPINSLKMARDWTPGLQIISKKFAEEVAAGGQREAAARTRMALSWMLAQNVWAQAKTGTITGGGPSDWKENKIWRDAGNVPYSINGWSYNWFEPMARVVGATADMAYFSNRMDPDDVMDVAGALATTGYRMLENNWWLRTMEGVTEVMTGFKGSFAPEDKDLALANIERGKDIDVEDPRAARLGLTVAKVGFAPFATVAGGGTVGGKIRENLDPEVKDIRNMADFFLSKIPGQSGAVLPHQNWSGEDKLIPPVLSNRFLNFVLPSIRGPVDGDPVAQFLDKHEVYLSDNWKNHEQTNLDGEESYSWKKLAFTEVRDFNDRTWKEALDALENDPEFHEKTRDQKRRQVNRTYARFRDLGFKALTSVNPNVADKYENAKLLKKEKRGHFGFEPSGAEGDAQSEAAIEQEIEVEQGTGYPVYLGTLSHSEGFRPAAENLPTTGSE